MIKILKKRLGIDKLEELVNTIVKDLEFLYEKTLKGLRRDYSEMREHILALERRVQRIEDALYSMINDKPVECAICGMKIFPGFPGFDKWVKIYVDFERQRISRHNAYSGSKTVYLCSHCAAVYEKDNLELFKKLVEKRKND